MSMILMLLAGSLFESAMETTMETVKALMETIRAFMFGRQHNYRGGWKP